MGDPVTITELIQRLIDVRLEYGDAEVFVLDESEHWEEPVVLARTSTAAEWRPPVPIGSKWVSIA